MVDPTPLFASRTGSKSTGSSDVTVDDFTAKFEENFFEMLGLELNDVGFFSAEDEERDSSEEKQEAQREVDEINLAIADGCCTYATQKIAALSRYFTSDTSEQELNMRANVNDFIRAGETAFRQPLSQKAINHMLQSCPTKTSVDFFNTNIFPSPAIHR